MTNKKAAFEQYCVFIKLINVSVINYTIGKMIYIGENIFVI